MIQRIQELELEAIAYADSKVPANDRYNDIYHSIVRGKFAELIVQECLTTVLKESKWYWDKDEFESANAIQNAARRVKEHFGVEE